MREDITYGMSSITYGDHIETVIEIISDTFLY